MEFIKILTNISYIYRYGNWGICFIYGTWFALQGLKAAGKTYKNCLAIRKGVDFLLKTQREDGGWGESHLSCPRKVINIAFFFIYLRAAPYNQMRHGHANSLQNRYRYIHLSKEINRIW